MTTVAKRERQSGENVVESLFLIFRPRLALALTTIQRSHEYNIGDESFRVIDKSLVAFYDWIRNPVGQIIGVRFWLESEELFRDKQLEWLNHLYRFPYVVKAEDGHALEVYISSNHQSDGIVAGELDFFPQEVFVNKKGVWAVCLRVAELDPSEMEVIKVADVDWEIVRCE